MRLVTIATLTTLAQARALARSLERHQPDWRLEVLLVAPALPERAPGPQLSVRLVADVLDIDVELLIGRHDERDLIALLLAPTLRAYLKKFAGPVLHLPPTVWVTGNLEPVVEAISRKSVMLVPRMTADVPDDGLLPSRADMERAGRFSETIMGVDGTEDADGFLAWWERRVEQALGSIDGYAACEHPEDRLWLARLLELAPARFSTAVLDDPGCNVSLWNINRRSLESTAEGVLVNGRWPLRFLDLTGFEPEHPYRLSATASRARVSRSPALRELCVTYAAELEEAGWPAMNEHRQIGRRLSNGLLYDETLCSLHARAVAFGEHFDDLFGEGSRAFMSWLEGPAPRGAGHGITRYVFYRVLRERPDVVRVYAGLDGDDGTGFAGWCWVFGREEMGIPERFMPPVPPELLASGLVEPAMEPGAATEPMAQANGVGGRTEHKRLDAAADGERDDSPSPPLLDGHPSSVPAVRVSGYLGHALGLGAAARGYAQALSAAGVPTSTVTVPLHHMRPPVTLGEGYGRHSFDDLVHDGHHGLELVAVNPDELPAFVERVGEDYFQGPRIGIWGWETNSIPARWQRAFSLVDEVWVYSRFMAENIGAVSPVPVIVLPPPVKAPTALAEPVRRGVPDGFLFLFMFDYLSTIQRKNPVGLIEAFKRAFAPGEGPQLLIKTINGPLRPLAEEAVLWDACGREDIHVVDRSLSGEERDALIAGCDCYVSLHRSEGFGLTMAEAMALGKPVIGTGYSGNVDFMNGENSYLVDYEIGRVGPDCEIYPADGEWAQPSVEHAAELMRHVVERPEEAAALGARASEDIARTLSLETTGAAMRRRLEELSRPASTDAR